MLCTQRFAFLLSFAVLGFGAAGGKYANDLRDEFAQKYSYLPLIVQQACSFNAKETIYTVYRYEEGDKVGYARVEDKEELTFFDVENNPTTYADLKKAAQNKIYGITQGDFFNVYKFHNSEMLDRGTNGPEFLRILRTWPVLNGGDDHAFHYNSFLNPDRNLVVIQTEEPYVTIAPATLLAEGKQLLDEKLVGALSRAAEEIAPKAEHYVNFVVQDFRELKIREQLGDAGAFEKAQALTPTTRSKRERSITVTVRIWSDGTSSISPTILDRE